MKNKFLTKVFAVLTAFVMTLTLVPNVTFAAESGKPELKVSVDKSELERTGEFTASVSLNTNNVANISGLQLRLKYDSDVLETVGDVTRILPTRSNELCSPSVDTVNNSANFIYALYDDGASLDYNGVVYTIKFKVKDNANFGKSDLTIDTQTAYPIKNGLDNIDIDSTIINSSINVVNPLNKISLGKETSTLNVGDTETLTVTYDPEDTTEDKTVTWESSNKDVVSVDNGQVTAKNVGEAVVTAKVGTKTASIKYTVVAPLKGISITGDNSLLKGEEKQLTVVYDPENTTDDKTVTWESLNKDVLTVDENGKISGIKEGTAIVKAVVAGKEATKEITVIEKHIDSVSLSGDDSILKGESKRLTATINPEDTTDDKTITWSSDDENVLFIDQNGQMRGIKEGTANVKAVVAGKETTKQITVNEIHIDSITIDGDQEFEMVKNQTKNLSAKINPDNTTDDDKNITWTSNKDDVAKVDNNGKVTALKEGEATITAKVGTHETSVKVNVKEIHIDSVVINELDDEFTRGDEFKFSASYTPENTTDENKTVEWSSSNTDVGTIDQEGNFVALKEGTTKITAKIGNIKAEREVTVIENHVGDFKLLQEEGEVLNIGNTQKLVTVVNPENCTDAYTIKYSSSDEAIATVDENGNVTALKDGKVVITATLTTEYDDEFEDSIEINIPAKEVISNKAEDGTTNGAATQEATSPKTGDVAVVLISVVMLGALTTLVVTKRKSVKQK